MSLVYTSKGSRVSNTSEDKINHRLDNVLSISHVETTGGTCTFCGIDGAEVVTNFPGPGSINLKNEEDVGPPQTIVFAVCT